MLAVHRCVWRKKKTPLSGRRASNRRCQRGDDDYGLAAFLSTSAPAEAGGAHGRGGTHRKPFSETPGDGLRGRVQPVLRVEVEGMATPLLARSRGLVGEDAATRTESGRGPVFHCAASRTPSRPEGSAGRIPQRSSDAAQLDDPLRPLSAKDAHMPELRRSAGRLRREDDRREHRGPAARRRPGQPVRYSVHRIRRQRSGQPGRSRSLAVSQQARDRRIPAGSAIGRAPSRGQRIGVSNRPC